MHTANKPQRKDLRRALLAPRPFRHPTLPHQATQELTMTKARRRGLLVHTGWNGKSQMQWRIVLLFLFLINEPVGMCHSAVELNGSCCSCKTNKSPSTQATSVATFLALSIQGLWKGHRIVGGAPSPASPGPSLLTLFCLPPHWPSA